MIKVCTSTLNIHVINNGLLQTIIVTELEFLVVKSIGKSAAKRN